ncbi:hypothetical protein V2J09_020121 [Rumex salicifolius]
MANSHLDSIWILAFLPEISNSSYQNIFLFLSFIFSCMAIYHWAHPGGPAWGKHYRLTPSGLSNKIPGPRGYPLIGSPALMTGLAHRKLAAAAEYFGASRLMAFTVGETRFVVASEPDVARQILNSPVFVDRPWKESAQRQMFSRAIGFAPYGVYWRMLRKIAAVHVFSPGHVARFENQRAEIVAKMAATIGGAGGGVVRTVLKRGSLSNMMASVFGKKYEVATWRGEAAEVGRLVDEGYELLGMLNWSDHMPWLAWMDLQRIRVRCSDLVPRVDRFVGRIISERKERKQSGDYFVDVLLSLEGEDKLTDSDMVSVLWEMIFRGTDTVAAVIEWVLARMVIHPEIQSKVHEELDHVIGKSRPLSESDLPSLHYLQAVIKEALRLHPPGPLLSWARLSITDTTIDGHHVPAGTTAMVNMWAIARDPKYWADPLTFSPERFLTESETDLGFCIMGSDLRLAPFGSGRRSCPGKSLGLTTITFWLGSLLHEFEWASLGSVDLSEVLGLSSEMAKPLCVTVHSRRG